MDINTALVVIAVIYAVLIFFDNFFKTCAHYPYIKFLEGTGVRINFLSITWATKAFNRTIIRWGTSKPRFFNIWFNIGLYISLILQPIAVGLLLFSLFQQFISGTNKDQNFVVEPIIPGINLPVSELGYYSGTIIVCSIIHELGHALAAVMDDVNLIDVGIKVYFIFPVAYVNLATDKLFTIERKKTLRILCAGIWHNIVLSTAAFLLYLVLPIFFASFFHVNQGVVITEIAKNSPVLGPKGLSVGDRVFMINDCKVTDTASWYQCFSGVEEHQAAFCINPELIHYLDESVHLKHSENGNLDCCDGTKLENMCFEYLDSNDGILELPSHACLPIRKVVEQSVSTCTQAPHTCPSNHYCFRPMTRNGTLVIKLNCINKMVLYLGYTADIYRTTDVSSYVPKFLFTKPTVPDSIVKFSRYVVAVSLGLALVNIIPFVYMDGHYILEIISYMFLREKLGKAKYNMAVIATTSLFTAALAIHCIMFIYRNVV